MPVILAAISTFVAWLAKSVLLKGLVLGAIVATVALMFDELIALLPDFLNGTELQSAIAQIPASNHLVYAWNLLLIPQGLSLILSAYVVRFTIRRLPGIG